MSDSVRPHRWQPTRLPHPWDSPGKNTGVGCHFLLQCMKVKSESEVTQSCLTLCNPMGSPPGPSAHGVFQARVLEWGAIAFSRDCPRYRHYSPDRHHSQTSTRQESKKPEKKRKKKICSVVIVTDLLVYNPLLGDS